ncbi:hypothetical protein [Microbacterium paludicola]|uniref:hypothetical protein n=1 Tax=Microbacterium paludicola TaxID=300019 RepID=UPI0016432EF7|nr:hypothetical protein [Microbacterium paludicola]
MFFALGLVPTIVIAFVSPYVWDGSADSSTLTAVTTTAAIVGLAGGGHLLDHFRKRSGRGDAAAPARSPTPETEKPPISRGFPWR